MTVQSRGARVRRGGRRPGWLLLTALLVLAIGASSALVFTNRVELLKLAVILALWAAVVAAFVSVLYRRQSDVDQARARDLKMVYDLQLDREISARREYELTVESQLRRELASELRAQAADEVAALRAELAALRTNLEILFDTNFEHRPALEPERASVRAYSDWAPDAGAQSRPPAEDSTTRTAENPIIDVPEVGVPAVGAGPARFTGQPEYAREHAPEYSPEYGGAHHPGAGYDEPAPSRGSHWRAAEEAAPAPTGERWPTATPQPEPAAPTGDWQPVGAQGHWLPPGTAGSNWDSQYPTAVPAEPASDADRAAWAVNAADGPAAFGEPRGRHSTAPGPAPVVPAEPDPQWRYQEDPQPVPARHWAEPVGHRAEMAAAAPPEPAARHRSPDDTAGQSVADILARLQAGPTVGGGRRRRAE